MMPAQPIYYTTISFDRVPHPDLIATMHFHDNVHIFVSHPPIFTYYSPPSSSFVTLSTSSPYNGGSKNSLQELEKNATATPKTAMLLTTLAFSGEVKVLYALEI